MNLLPLLQASPEALHLAGWCVYVCVWNSCSPVLHGEGQGGDTDELQLWPWGLWELWLEQCGKRIRGKRKDERGREEIHWEKKRLQAETR